MTRQRARRDTLAPRDDVLTPKRVVEVALPACPAELEPVVLYTCGSLCPIHKQHVHIQEMAKAQLEADHPIQVVGGFVASSNDLYVEGKYRAGGPERMQSFLPWAKRAELIELALASHPFIVQDRWDGEQQPHFQEYFDAHASLQTHLDSWCAAKALRRVRVLAVHGADLVEKCNIASWYPRMGLGLVTAERPGYPMPALTAAQQRDRSTYLLPLPPAFVQTFGKADISSSAVQRLLRAPGGTAEGGLTVQDMLHPDVEAELRQEWGLPVIEGAGTAKCVVT